MATLRCKECGDKIGKDTDNLYDGLCPECHYKLHGEEKSYKPYVSAEDIEYIQPDERGPIERKVDDLIDRMETLEMKVEILIKLMKE